MTLLLTRAIEELETIPVRPEFRDRVARVIQSLKDFEIEAKIHRGSLADLIPGVHLSKNPRRLVQELMDRGTKGASRDQLMAAMYFDRPNAEPDVRMVQVLICKIRKKLIGTEWRIRNVWGQGYVLERIVE